MEQETKKYNLIIWVIVRISGTSECVVKHWTTPCMYMYQSKKIKRHSWHRRNCCISRNCCLKWPWKASLERHVVNLSTFLLIYFFIYFSNFFVSISKPFQSLTSHFKIPNTVCLASFLRITSSYSLERILSFLFCFT